MQDETTAERDKQVEVQLKQQDCIIGEFGMQIDQLTVSLFSVLSEEMPSAEKDENKVEQSLCPLANNIRDHNYKLRRMEASIANLLSRLEV